MQFKLDTFQNPYLSAGTNRVDAILTVTAEGEAGGAVRAESVVGLILDVSGSMKGARLEAVKAATRQAVGLLDEGAWFFIVAFSDGPYVIAPLAQASATNKAFAQAQVQQLVADGTTVMSAGLTAARAQFAKRPGALHYALFLTDGKNNANDEASLDAALAQCEGAFQCDCRGVGTDWQPRQLQKIARALLGTAMIIPEPSGMEADFRAAIQGAQGRGVGDVRLRLWTPKSARIVACKQMSPEIVTLTDRAAPVDGQTHDYPTGAWGREARDYYVAVEIAPGDAGDEMLACRPSIIFADGGQDVKAAGAPVLATWTDDEVLSARINPQVAHYTGQEELAEAIQTGLEARAQGDATTATKMLGRAAQLAVRSGNDDTTRRLAKVVDIVDADAGTVRLKSAVNKADEMDLDLGSTRTARVARKPQGEA